MKKYFLLTLLLICTGCSKLEYLNCSKEQTDNGLTMSESIKLEINNNKPVSVTIDIGFGLEGSYLEHKDVVKSNIDEIVNVYQNLKGIQVSSLEDENKIAINLQAKYDEIPDSINNDQLNIRQFNMENIDIDENKKRLENEGYSCNISN